MLPFLLLIGVFLLLMYRVTHASGGFGNGDGGEKWPTPLCEKGHETYAIVRGDTCWDLAQKWGVKVEDLVRSNEDLDCESLDVGRKICVPKGQEEGFGRLR
jgi:LysM domain